MDLNQHILDSLPIIRFTKDQDGLYKDVNDTYEITIGLSREKIIGKRDEQIFPERLYRSWKSWESRVMKENISGKHEFSLRYKGKDRTFLLFYEPAGAGDDRRKEFIGWSLELTNQEREESTFQTILDSLNTGYLLIDPESHIIQNVNRKAEEILGLTAAGILGRDCQNFICPVQNEKCPMIDQCGKVENIEGLLTDSLKRKIPILKTIIPIVLENKRYFLESFVDISAQKTHEGKLRKNIEELEKFNKLTIDREERMIELKQEINQLCEELGREKRYKINLNRS